MKVVQILEHLADVMVLIPLQLWRKGGERSACLRAYVIVIASVQLHETECAFLLTRTDLVENAVGIYCHPCHTHQSID